MGGGGRRGWGSCVLKITIVCGCVQVSKYHVASAYESPCHLTKYSGITSPEPSLPILYAIILSTCKCI